MSNIKIIKQTIKDLKEYNENLKKERNKLREDLVKINSEYEITHKQVKELSRELFTLKSMNQCELKTEVDSINYENGDEICLVDSSILGMPYY